MYTSYIGKKFLKLYNEKENKNLSARQFFDQVMFPLFFDDGRHLMHVGNSPFFQKVSNKDLTNGKTKSQVQLCKLHNDIENDAPNMAIYVGFAAKDVQGTTSGQVTDIDFNIQKDEMYASWIGQALAICIKGGLSLLISVEEILWILFNGWQYYRNYLEQTPNVKDKQIETWNGQWICHCFSKNYDSEYPYDNMSFDLEEIKGNLAISTKNWSEVVFFLAKKYPNKTVMAYVYSLSQTNVTLGFINLYLPQVHKLYDLRDKVFIDRNQSNLKDKQIENLQTFYTFKNACKLGSIGLKALEPDKLRDYMPKGSILYAKNKDFKLSNEESYFTFNIYKLWIIAMLNKTELLALATEIAKALLDLKSKDQRGKTVFSNLAEEVRNASNIRGFIEKLTNVLSEAPENAEVFKNVVEQVLKMPSDNFPLFITLVRFEYVCQQSKN